MATKQKTSVAPGAKTTNKNSTEKARKAATAEIAERLERMEAGDDAKTGPAYADDGTLKTVSIPSDEPPQEHEVQSAKEVANDRHIAAAAREIKKRDRAAAKVAKPPKQPKPEKTKKVSGLDAAALVLAETGAPMKAVDMLAEIQKRGLWASKGRTPEATLYAAIIREIAAKGTASRFKKHDRGLFVAASNGKGE